MKYITEAVYDSCNGYMVRIQIIGVSKWFSVAKYGSATKAKSQAIRFRNRQLKKHNMSGRLRFIGKGKGPMKSHVRNTSGVIGVKLEITERGENIYEGWCAYSMIQGRQLRKTFSINKYGNCEAFKMACQFRQKHSGTLIVLNKENLPCLPDVEYIVKNSA